MAVFGSERAGQTNFKSAIDARVFNFNIERTKN